MKEKKEQIIIKYKPYAIRLHEETYKRLKEKRDASGLSWNLFVVDLLDKATRRKM